MDQITLPPSAIRQAELKELAKLPMAERLGETCGKFPIRL